MDKIKSVEKDLTFGALLRAILMQSKLLVLLITLSLGLAVALYVNSPKVFKVSSLIEVFEDNENAFNNDLALEVLLSGSGTSNIQNLTALYQSRNHLMDVIEKNFMQITHKNDIYIGDYFEVLSFDQYYDENGINFSIKMSEDEFILKLDDAPEKNLSYGEVHRVDGVILKAFNAPSDDLEINARYVPMEDVYKALKSSIQIMPANNFQGYSRFDNTGAIHINYQTDDPINALRILDYSNQKFIDNSIEIESTKAKKALNYIDERLVQIESRLEEQKNLLKNFKESNNSINVDLEIQKVIDQLAAISEKINELNVEILSASQEYTSSNPLFINLKNQKQELERQRDSIKSQISNLPFAEQEYIDLYNDLELTQTLYSELLNRKLELSIKEASTLGNIRIVDKAYTDIKVSPQLSQIFFVFAFLSTCSLFFTLVRGIYFLPISNPAEINDNGLDLPIIGVISKIEDAEEFKKDNLKLNQAMENLIVNINSLNKNGGKVITITSPTPANGKSFASRNIARSLAEIKNKTLLIDFDFKRGSLAKVFGVEKIRKNDFDSLNKETIEKFKVDNNFYFLPRITRLRNSFEFFYSDAFNKKLGELKENFDFIVIDTGPILSVSDTAMILSKSDISLMVARHGLTKLNELKQANAILEQMGIEIDGIIYNFYEKPSSYYGYYGYYGNYSYQYYANKYLYESYDYENE
tara:strand:+ start:7144 stop:9240 length:2097 start_codon:yes stop_codon:yes gene_type:complete